MNTPRMIKTLTFLCALLSISTAFARADVSLRNGNFYVTFRDLSYPGGLEPKIERVYNSKSDFKGIFGYGWGTEYETHLDVDPDGSLIVSAYGGGADNRFVVKNYKKKDLEKSADELLAAAKKAGLVSNQKQSEEFRKKLISDFDFRAQQYSLLVSKGLMTKKVPKEGTQYISTHYMYQYITKVKGGYVQVLDGGNIQKFNEAGKLVQIQDRNKNTLTFSYNENNQLVKIVDSQNRKMNLDYNDVGLVSKVTGESGKSASYSYDKEKMLSGSRDENGIANTYAYSKDIYHNLTEIGHPNKKDDKGNPRKMTIEYYPVKDNLNVKSVTNLDGTTNEYQYFKDSKKKDYFAVQVLLKEKNGTRISDSKYEYFTKIRTGGEPYTAKMVSTVNGDKTITEYDDKLGFPVKITNDGRVTQMKYDAKGRMVKKVTPFDTTQLSYDNKSGKVSKVVRKQKSGRVKWSAFKYDATTGNLTHATNSDKKSVKIIWDKQGRILALSDQSGRQLKFKYGDHHQPVEIADSKLGSVKLTYKNSGEVDQMTGNGGNQATGAVLGALNELIEITQPSGVTMGL